MQKAGPVYTICLMVYLVILSTTYCKEKIKALKVIFYKAMTGTVKYRNILMMLMK